MKYYLYHVKTDQVCKLNSKEKHDFCWLNGGLKKGSLISLKKARYIILYIVHEFESTSEEFNIIKL